MYYMLPNAVLAMPFYSLLGNTNVAYMYEFLANEAPTHAIYRQGNFIICGLVFVSDLAY